MDDNICIKIQEGEVINLLIQLFKESMTHRVLFDTKTELWVESPKYILDDFISEIKRRGVKMLKVKDSVGGIYKRTKDEKEEWYLLEDTINKIVETKNGRKYYTKSKFRPLDADDVDSSTEILENAKGYIIVREVFGLNDITRPIAEKWVVWANENMDKAVSVMLQEDV